MSTRVVQDARLPSPRFTRSGQWKQGCGWVAVNAAIALGRAVPEDTAVVGGNWVGGFPQAAGGGRRKQHRAVFDQRMTAPAAATM